MNPALRTALVVAHPDDETIGAAGLLLRAHDLFLVHVTDGAPRDGVDACMHGFATVEQYAAARAAEAAAALRLVALPQPRWIRLAYPDQGAYAALDRITADLARFFAGAQIEQVVTHPYEGGHPATACAVHRAATAPIVEMTSYHADADGTLVSGRFLPNGDGTTELALDAHEYAIKQAMFRAHATQARTLAQFPCGRVERYRPAPCYDFAQPPHARPLFYERCGWTSWRAA
jgi:LmbE family N-acetylglucosaminyl deacetylase